MLCILCKSNLIQMGSSDVQLCIQENSTHDFQFYSEDEFNLSALINNHNIQLFKDPWDCFIIIDYGKTITIPTFQLDEAATIAHKYSKLIAFT